MTWQSQLCRVRFELLDGEGDERTRLEQAAKEFRSAYGARATWPPELRRRGERLFARLFVGNSLIALDRVDEEELRDVSDQLWQFCEVAEPCPWDAAAAGVRGIEHLWEARGLLHKQEGDLRERLRAATRSFRAAALHVESWPDALRSAAEAITARLSKYGSEKPDESVRRMGNRTAREISQDLLRLCEDADRHQSSDEVDEKRPR